MGLGPRGPPIPPAVTYSVVSLPSGCPAPAGSVLSDCFALLDSSPPDDSTEDVKDKEEVVVESLPVKVTHTVTMKPYAGLTCWLTRTVRRKLKASHSDLVEKQKTKYL